MSLARNLRRSAELRQKLLIKRPVPESSAERELRKAFLHSALPIQLKRASMPELNEKPVSEKETKRERRVRLAFTWIARILTFGLAFKKKG